MTAGTDIRLAEETARALAAAAGSARLYPAGSPMTMAAVDRFVDMADQATADWARSVSSSTLGVS